MIDKENSDLNIMIENLLNENNTYSQCKTYKVEIKELTKASQIERIAYEIFWKTKRAFKIKEA